MSETYRSFSSSGHFSLKSPNRSGNAWVVAGTLAAEANLNRTYLSAVEREELNISLDNIHKLAVALELAACHLIDAGSDFGPDGLARIRAGFQLENAVVPDGSADEPIRRTGRKLCFKSTQ